MNYTNMSKGRYLFLILRHPVVAFEEMKYNKKGSVLYASILLLLFYITVVLQQVGTGFVVSTTNPDHVNVLWLLAGTVGGVILWCVSNWMFCTLLNGKGRFGEIFVATCYALLPYVLLGLPMTLFSHILTKNEQVFYQVAMTLIVAWVGILLFVGMMCMHQFSISQNVATILLTLVGIAILLFLLVLLFTLFQNVWVFLMTIVDELSFRFR